MKPKTDRVKIGIIGCGAIGSRIAKSVKKDFKKDCRLTGLYDIDREKAVKLSRSLSLRSAVKRTIPELIRGCDCMVEAVSAKNTDKIVRQALAWNPRPYRPTAADFSIPEPTRKFQLPDR